MRLDVYLAGHCATCARAYEPIGRAGERFPGVIIAIHDLDQSPAAADQRVVAVPTYVLDGSVLCIGNPDEHTLWTALAGNSGPRTPAPWPRRDRWRYRMGGRRTYYPALDPQAPLGCDVFLAADPEQDRRLVALRAHRSAPLVDRADGGLELRFRGLPWETLVAFVEHERRCCEFFSFELEEQGDEVVLRVWGRDGVRGYLRGDLAEP